MARPCRSFVLVVAGALAIASAACEPADQPRPASRQSVHIVLIGEARDEPTWAVIKAAAQWFPTLYRQATVLVTAPETPSPDKQQELLAALLSEEVDAVCIAPTDPRAIEGVLKDLVQHGKRVVTIGRDAAGSGRYAYCGPSEFEIGQAAAQACGEILRGRSRTIMLLHAGTDDDVYGSRYYGFKNELPVIGNVKVLREMDCRGKWLDAERLVRAESRKYPRTGAWILLDDWPFRAIPAAERLVPFGCGIVLCNGSPRHLDRLRHGEILAMVVFDYRRAVEAALFAAVQSDQQRASEIRSSIHIMPCEIITTRELEAYERRWTEWQSTQPAS